MTKWGLDWMFYALVAQRYQDQQRHGVSCFDPGSVETAYQIARRYRTSPPPHSQDDPRALGDPRAVSGHYLMAAHYHLHPQNLQ